MSTDPADDGQLPELPKRDFPDSPYPPVTGEEPSEQGGVLVGDVSFPEDTTADGAANPGVVAADPLRDWTPRHQTPPQRFGRRNAATPPSVTVPVPRPATPKARVRAEQQVRIGLWGAAGGGKTTYLAALRVASLRGSTEPGNWTVRGGSAEASQFLIAMTDRLVRERRFPEASTNVEPLSWRIHGDLLDDEGIPEKSRRGGWLSGWLRRPEAARREVDFVLELQDSPGNRFLFDGQDPAHDDVLDNLADSDGLLYLFDPIRDVLEDDERHKGNFEYFHRALEHLLGRLQQRGELIGGRLPHYVAVCITKFDHPHVFAQAVEAGQVSTAPNGQPWVPNGDAPREFFAWLCERHPASGADLVRDSLRRFFHPDRVAYFACSSIGFSLRADRVFDARNCNNVITIDGERHIRDEVRPINVLEPLIGLERRIQTGSW